MSNVFVQPAAADEVKLQAVKGKLKALANKSKTLSIDVAGKGQWFLNLLIRQPL